MKIEFADIFDDKTASLRNKPSGGNNKPGGGNNKPDGGNKRRSEEANWRSEGKDDPQRWKRRFLRDFSPS